MALKKHRRLVVIQIVILLGMTAFVAAMVPLYNFLCKVLSISVPRVAVGDESAIAPAGMVPVSRTVEVRFVGEVNSGVPLQFAPMEYKRTVRLGEPVLTAYKAVNTSPAGFDGVAVHMLYGMGGATDGNDVARYVDLRQCFCFELQHYPAHETKTLPLNFVITPDLPAGIHTVTFAYTLFKSLANDPRLKKKP